MQSRSLERTPPRKKLPKCGKHLHRSENTILDSLPERSNTVLPLQPLPLQAQDRTPHRQMATAKHNPASFSMDLPHHLHLRICLSLPREHSMSMVCRETPLFQAAAANCVEADVGRQPNLGNREARGEGVRSRCAPSLLHCNIEQSPPPLAASLSRSNLSAATSGNLIVKFNGSARRRHCARPYYRRLVQKRPESTQAGAE